MRVLPDQPTLEKTKYPILETIIKCGFTPKKNGKNYLIRCPFHDDKTPSLVIYQDTQKWRCYGNCVKDNNGGDAIDFVRQRFGYSYIQAVNWLSDLHTVTFNVKWEPEEPPKPIPHQDVLYWHSLMDLENKREYFHSRGFEDWFIDQEFWGWDGNRYVIPVWEGRPGYSPCINIRRRKQEQYDSNKKIFKYIGLEGHNQPTVWGRYYCKGQKRVLAFAGEFDAARAVCDEFPAFSLVNGCQSFEAFPEGWPDLWFPDTQELIVVFDQGEEGWAGKFAGVWNSYKGLMTARLFQWPPVLNVKDYCEFRKNKLGKFFRLLLLEQGLKI